MQGAGRDRLRKLRNLPKGARDLASDHYRTEAGQKHGDEACAGNEPRRVGNAALHFRIDALRALGIELAKLCEVDVERLAHAAVGAVVSPFPARLRTNFDTSPHQLAPEFAKLLDPPGKSFEEGGIVRSEAVPPLFHDLLDLVVEDQESVAVNPGRGNIGGHVDAPRLHRHGIDKRVDPFHIQRAGKGGVEFLGYCGMPPRINYSHHGKGEGDGVSNAKITYSLVAIEKLGSLTLALPTH